MDWAYYVLLVIVQIVGLAITAIGLPGLWVMLLATVAYAWLTAWSYVGVWTLVALTLLCLASEAAEFFAGAAAAKSAGGSRRAMILAAIGAVIGGIVSTPIPIPGVAQIVGAVVGAGVGGLVGELTTGRGTTASLRVGYGAAKGRFFGTVLKLIFGVVILFTALVAAFPWGGRKTQLPTPTTIPAPAPLPAPTTPSTSPTTAPT